MTIRQLHYAIALSAALLLAGAGARGSTLGPDAFGYIANDATPYSFVDISSTGSSVLAGADDDRAEVGLGFPFVFYGRTFTSVCISSNGLLSFGGCNIDFANQDFTTTAPVGDFATIAPFWTDLTFAAQGAGSVYYQALGTPGARQFVVQWNNAYPLNAPEGVTFQVVLFEASGRVLLQFKDTRAGAGVPATDGGAATVGIRDSGGQANGRRLQWSSKAPVLRSGYAIEFLPLGATPVELGNAGPAYWAALVLGSPADLRMTASAVITGNTADVGIAQAGSVKMTGSARIAGKLWLAAGAELKQSGQASVGGGVVQGAEADARLAQARADALAASSAAAALPATLTSITSISIHNAGQSQTITGVAGRNVLHLTELRMSGQGALTLSGPSEARFVINVSGRFDMSGSATIALTGGLSPVSVLFNVAGTGQDVSMSGPSRLSGILLAPQRDVSLGPATLAGELISGGKVSLTGSARITN